MVKPKGDFQTDANKLRKEAEDLMDYLFDGIGEIPDAWRKERLDKAKREYQEWLAGYELDF